MLCFNNVKSKYIKKNDSLYWLLRQKFKIQIGNNGRVLLPEGNGWMKQFEENKMMKPTGIQNYVTRSKTWRAVLSIWLPFILGAITFIMCYIFII